jgi:hypothetical protein
MARADRRGASWAQWVGTSTKTQPNRRAIAALKPAKPSSEAHWGSPARRTRLDLPHSPHYRACTECGIPNSGYRHAVARGPKRRSAQFCLSVPASCAKTSRSLRMAIVLRGPARCVTATLRTSTRDAAVAETCTARGPKDAALASTTTISDAAKHATDVKVNFFMTLLQVMSKCGLSIAAGMIGNP